MSVNEYGEGFKWVGKFLNQDFLFYPQANSSSCKMINVAVKFKEKIHSLQGIGEYF